MPRQLVVDRLHRDAEVGTGHPPLVDQLVADPAGQVDRHGEGDPVVPPTPRRDGGVDAHHLSLQVHQRAATVARVDGRVGLQEVFPLGDIRASPLRRDDARCHRRVQPERAADGQHPVTHLDHVAVAQRESWQGAIGGNPQDRDVGLGIGANFGRHVLPSVGQSDQHAVGVGHHMVRRQDDPGGIDDEPGAASHGTRAAVTLRVLEEFAEPRVLLEQFFEGSAPEHLPGVSSAVATPHGDWFAAGLNRDHGGQ